MSSFTHFSLQVIHACWQSNSNGMGVWDSFWHLLSVTNQRKAEQFKWYGVWDSFWHLLSVANQRQAGIINNWACALLHIFAEHPHTHVNVVFPSTKPRSPWLRSSAVCFSTKYCLEDSFQDSTCRETACHFVDVFNLYGPKILLNYFSLMEGIHDMV